MDDDETIVHLLIGSAVAKRWKQLSESQDEAAWFAVAIAVQQVLDVIMRKPDEDPLTAIDEWFELEAMLAGAASRGEE